jgi:hypothetical protein
MNGFLKNIEDSLADSALLEMGVAVALVEQTRVLRETLEENLIEIAFAEEGAYYQIHEAILREHWRENDMVRFDDCQYGDNDVCFV